ncbi:hypothetical protein SAMN04487977_101530 [Treponema bryantii]|uniref:Uncharacterized protein n=1 Tax=Treponema bryantii TaxID=163 RepID=A0A1H9AZX4_9SPIR|nr:hypothetical protein [Treponema bryantii]SEP82284.1 hypothetical protein SAMN04487977_101530 [Treponema bryantii]
MKYRVVGRYMNGDKAYWNASSKGWYVHDYDATVFTDVEKANTASEIAEVTMTVDCVDCITFEEIK